MDNEIITTQERTDPSLKSQVEFDFSQLSPQTENMREEIEKSTHDTLLILGEMGFRYEQSIVLRILDGAVHKDELYHSTESCHKDLISFVQRLAQVRLKKDDNKQWKDVVLLPINHQFIEKQAKFKIMLSLAHEFAHLWMLQNTRFGKEIFPLRKCLAQQEVKIDDFQQNIVSKFGKINSVFHDIVSDMYFKSLSRSDQFDAIGESFQDTIKNLTDAYEVLTEVFSHECTADSFKRAKEGLDLLEVTHDWDLSLSRYEEQFTKNYVEERISQFKRLKENKAEDENSTIDYIIHTAEVERDNKLKKILIKKLFLEKGAYQFYPRIRDLMEKKSQGNNTENEVKKLEKEIFSTMEDLFTLEQIIIQDMPDKRAVNDEIQRFNDLTAFIEGFAKFVEEKFIDEYRRRNPDASYIRLDADELFDSTKVALSPYIKGLALFKSKYTTVREAMDAIRTMSIDDVKKEFLS